MELRMWERIVLMIAAISLILYVWTKAVIFELNQVQMINKIFNAQVEMQKRMGPIPPKPKPEG